MFRSYSDPVTALLGVALITKVEIIAAFVYLGNGCLIWSADFGRRDLPLLADLFMYPIVAPADARVNARILGTIPAKGNDADLYVNVAISFQQGASRVSLAGVLSPVDLSRAQHSVSQRLVYFSAFGVGGGRDRYVTELSAPASAEDFGSHPNGIQHIATPGNVVILVQNQLDLVVGIHGVVVGLFEQQEAKIVVQIAIHLKHRVGGSIEHTDAFGLLEGVSVRKGVSAGGAHGDVFAGHRSRSAVGGRQDHRRSVQGPAAATRIDKVREFSGFGFVSADDKRGCHFSDIPRGIMYRTTIAVPTVLVVVSVARIGILRDAVATGIVCRDANLFSYRFRSIVRNHHRRSDRGFVDILSPHNGSSRTNPSDCESNEPGSGKQFMFHSNLSK